MHFIFVRLEMTAWITTLKNQPNGGKIEIVSASNSLPLCHQVMLRINMIILRMQSRLILSIFILQSGYQYYFVMYQEVL